MKERLHKILARRGIASLRHAEQLIADGHVSVNGKVIDRQGTFADPDADSIRVDGKPLPHSRDPLVLMLNKPSGYLCTSSKGREEFGDTVFDLVPRDRRYFTVGRLDRDSSGLILLTDDGDLANRLTHPRYGTTKVYQVETQWPLPRTAFAELTRGIALEDGVARALKVSVVTSTRFRLTMGEGRKREIRRMVQALGSRVTELQRIQIGGLKLGTLPEGEWRVLTAAEKKLLFSEKSTIITSEKLHE
jgi:23S rRNA pseudouridine2605 synthase